MKLEDGVKRLLADKPSLTNAVKNLLSIRIAELTSAGTFEVSPSSPKSKMAAGPSTSTVVVEHYRNGTKLGDTTLPRVGAGANSPLTKSKSFTLVAATSELQKAARVLLAAIRAHADELEDPVAWGRRHPQGKDQTGSARLDEISRYKCAYAVAKVVAGRNKASEEATESTKTTKVTKARITSSCGRLFLLWSLPGGDFTPIRERALGVRTTSSSSSGLASAAAAAAASPSSGGEVLEAFLDSFEAALVLAPPLSCSNGAVGSGSGPGSGAEAEGTATGGSSSSNGTSSGFGSGCDDDTSSLSSSKDSASSSNSDKHDSALAMVFAPDFRAALIARQRRRKERARRQAEELESSNSNSNSSNGGSGSSGSSGDGGASFRRELQSMVLSAQAKTGSE